MDKQTYFIEKLNFYLSKKGASKSALASHLGCISSLVDLWLNGERKPDEEMVQKIADFFNVGVEEFILKEDINSDENSKRKVTKRHVLGTCTRCGKPIYQGDIFGKGESKRVIKSEMFKNPVEETVFIYEKGGSGYEYFCENCCDYLILQNKLEQQKDDRDKLAFLMKIKRMALAIGFNAFLISFAAVLLFVFDLFGIFNFGFSDLVKSVFAASTVILGYFSFSLVYVAMSGKTWVYDVLAKTANVLFAYVVGNTAKSDNEVLSNAVARIIVVVVIAAFSTVLFTPICVLMGMFSMILWPTANKLVNIEIDELRNELYK